MNLNKNTLATFLMIFLFSQFSHSQISLPFLHDVIPDNEKSRLLRGEILTRVSLKGKSGFSTNPDEISMPNLDGFINDIDQYEMVAIEKAFFPFVFSDSALDSLIRHLLCFSCLSGIEYYSINDKKVQALVKECHLISNSDSTGLAGKPSAEMQSLAHVFMMHDNRFGKLRFRCDLHISGMNILVSNTSLDSMSKLVFPINDAGEYRMFYLFQYDPDAKGLFYTAVQLMRIKNNFLLKLGKLSSGNFANRIRAITVYLAEYFGLGWNNRLIAAR